MSAARKYRVLDAGGESFEVEATKVEEVFEPTHRVSFFKGGEPVATFRAPTSWGPVNH